MSLIAQLLRAELLKIRTSRVTWALLAAMALVTLVVVVLTLSTLDADELAGSRGVRRVLTLGGAIAGIFTLALGIVGVAGEYRHDTFGQTLLAAPARWQAVVAKVLAYALAALLFGLVALVVTFAVGAPGLADDARISLSNELPRSIVLGTLLTAMLFAVIGVGLATLLRDLALALSVGLGWTLLVDSLAMALVPEVGRFLPGGAVTGVLRSQTQNVLQPAPGALLLLGYAVAFAVAGALAVRRRDLA